MQAGKMKTIWVILFTALLAACGGNTEHQPGTQDQTIAFNTPGTASGAVGTTVTNTASGGAGTGAVSYLSSNISIARVDPMSGVATLNSVGSTTITATKAASNGFNQATATYTLNVTPGAQSIVFLQAGPLQMLTGDTINNIASGGAGTGAISYVSSNPGVVTVSPTSGIAMAISVGTATITATKVADANYAQATASYILTVAAGSQSIAFAQSGPLQMLSGATINNVASGGAGTGAISYASSNIGVITVDAATGAATGVNAGTATITATKAADANYSQAQASYTVTVQNQNQIISFATPGTISGAIGTTVTNVASGGAGTGAVSYLSSNIGVATVNPMSGVATLNSAGSTTITATKAASSGFNQATATYTLNVTVIVGPQTISFAQAGPLQVLNGFTISNTASGGAGTGSITYVSSNTNAVTVNAASGVATAVGIGSATITATKAADANYPQAQATYLLTVQTQAPIGVSAWIGPNDAQVTLPSLANGMSFIRSRDRNCNIANYSVCIAGQSDIAAGQTITDTAANTSATGYYWLQSGGNSTSALAVNTQRFSGRIGHAVVLFNNRYWLIGGGELTNATAQYTAKSDVWSSADGKTWVLETADGGFGARWFHSAVVFNNRIWILSGVATPAQSPLPWYADSWSSADGVNWRQESTNLQLPWWSATINVFVSNGELLVVSGGRILSYDAATRQFDYKTSPSISALTNSIGGRSFASLTFYNGQWWYIGGRTETPINTASVGNTMNDVWTSPDGITWMQQPNAPFSTRYHHSAFVVGGKLWVMGGQISVNGVDGAVSADAWSTTDGITWTQGNVATAIDRSTWVATVQETNKVTLIGGSIGGITNKAWQSTDGSHWTNLSSFAQFSPRQSVAVEFLGDLWLVGGGTAESLTTNEIWRSNDGMNWTQVIPVGSVFSPRDGHQVIVFNNRLWVIGGWDDLISAGGTETRFNDVWSSADGINWIKQTPTGAIFSPRVSSQAVVFNSKLWIIGGNTATNTNTNEVWSTVDGSTWVQEIAGAAFPARSNHAVVGLNNTLWLTGGQNSSTVFADIWKSTDGINWSLVTPVGASFAARSGHAMTTYNNNIWLTGGWNGLSWNTGSDYSSAARFNDVWSSADGVNWVQVTPAAQFQQRVYPALVNHNNELWLIGGLNFDRFNDVWRSTDGINWRVGFNQTMTAH